MSQKNETRLAYHDTSLLEELLEISDKFQKKKSDPKLRLYAASYLYNIAKLVQDKQYGDLAAWANDFLSSYYSRDVLTPKQMAERLNNTLQGQEMNGEDIHIANLSDLVVVYGYSDDVISFRGAFTHDYGNAFYPGYILLDPLMTPIPIVSDEFIACNNIMVGSDIIKNSKILTYKNNGKDFYWEFVTDFPVEAFTVLDEDGEPWCRGLVFSMEDLRRTT